MGISRPLFLYFHLFDSDASKQMFVNHFSMTGFEPQTSGVGRDRSSNCATTTALLLSKVRWSLTNEVCLGFESLDGLLML